jgi:hypothetical protein
LKETDMSNNDSSEGGRFTFLDPIANLFRAREKQAPAKPETASEIDSLLTNFDSALDGLEKKIEESRRAAQTSRRAVVSGKMTAADRAAANQLRMEKAHQEVREDIEKMHARLGTELASADLGELERNLQALQEDVGAGKDSHSLMPRMRYAIVDRIVKEVGEIAVERFVALLQEAKMSWPDPTTYRPSATSEEIERAQRRRLAEVREGFLAKNLERTAEQAVGVVRGWKADYPDRGTPLWEDCVLQGVAAGMRGQLVLQATEILRRNRDAILDQAQAAIGKELDAIQAALQGGGASPEQANRAMSSSLGVLDQVVPEIAWKHVESQLPAARNLATAPGTPAQEDSEA